MTNGPYHSNRFGLGRRDSVVPGSSIGEYSTYGSPGPGVDREAQYLSEGITYNRRSGAEIKAKLSGEQILDTDSDGDDSQDPVALLRDGVRLPEEFFDEVLAALGDPEIVNE